ncbi:CoA-binding protein [Thermoproteota archaeon]
MNVVIIGASDKLERYSYKALKKLKVTGHHIFPVHPRLKDIHGIPVFYSLSDIKEPIHTVTIYVGAEKSSALKDEIFKINPKRIIFNPGTENQALLEEAKTHGIEVVEGCTLMMLASGVF